MIRNIAGDSKYQRTRFRLQSEKNSADPGAKASSVRRKNMRVLGATVGGLLRFAGFHERARQNCSDYRLERNDVYLPDLPATFDGYTILHLSDMHTDGLIDEGVGIIRVLEDVSCDLAVLTGDFIYEECSVDYEPGLKALGPIIRSISARDGIFGVLGNHDLLEMVPGLERIGVQMLLNDAVQLHRGKAVIVLAGVADPHSCKCPDIQHALSVVAQDQFVLLMSHSPEIAAEASRCGVGLFLCGHTHGGQICLPGGMPLFVNTSVNRRYASGSWKCGAMHGYTNRGTGFSLAAARIFCPPEITLHTLHSGGPVCEFYTMEDEYRQRWFEQAGYAIYA